MKRPSLSRTTTHIIRAWIPLSSLDRVTRSRGGTLPLGPRERPAERQAGNEGGPASDVGGPTPTASVRPPVDADYPPIGRFGGDLLYSPR